MGNRSWGGDTNRLHRLPGLSQSWISPISTPVTHRRVFQSVVSHGLFGDLFLWFGYFPLFSFIPPSPGRGRCFEPGTQSSRDSEMFPEATLLPFSHGKG